MRRQSLSFGAPTDSSGILVLLLFYNVKYLPRYRVSPLIYACNLSVMAV